MVTEEGTIFPSISVSFTITSITRAESSGMISVSLIAIGGLLNGVTVIGT